MVSMLCAVYTRQSVPSEGDLTSCEVQREMCLRFAKSRGLRISGDDEGISGATLERPALQRLLSGVRAGVIGAVVEHRLGRLSRRVCDCSALLEEFKAHNVRLFVAAMPELLDGAAHTRFPAQSWTTGARRSGAVTRSVSFCRCLIRRVNAS